MTRRFELFLFLLQRQKDTFTTTKRHFCNDLEQKKALLQRLQNNFATHADLFGNYPVAFLDFIIKIKCSKVSFLRCLPLFCNIKSHPRDNPQVA